MTLLTNTTYSLLVQALLLLDFIFIYNFEDPSIGRLQVLILFFIILLTLTPVIILKKIESLKIKIFSIILILLTVLSIDLNSRYVLNFYIYFLYFLPMGLSGFIMDKKNGTILNLLCVLVSQRNLIPLYISGYKGLESPLGLFLLAISLIVFLIIDQNYRKKFYDIIYLEEIRPGEEFPESDDLEPLPKPIIPLNEDDIFRKFALDFSSKNDISIEINLIPEIISIRRSLALSIISLLQESMKNSKIFNKATRAEIILIQKDLELFFHIKDNGNNSSNLDENPHLTNIKKIVKSLNGIVEYKILNSQEIKGVIPLEKDDYNV